MTFIEASVIIYLTFLIVILTIGFIKFNENVKTKIMVIFSAIYNTIIGYVDTIFFFLMYAIVRNQPKGKGYEVPASDAGFNMMLGIIILIVYICLLVPINIFIKRKSKISIKFYIVINVISTILGISLYWIFR